MRARFVALLAAVASLSVPSFPGSFPWQTPKSTAHAKATKTTPAFTFEAHNEGSAEGGIYGESNLVSLTIDAVGISYRGAGSDKPNSMTWAQISGWQANNFTSRSPGSGAPGDFGIGVYVGARYLSFRTRNGREYTGAIRVLRVLAAAKERPGIG
jgi:hypothetical protein